MIGTSEHLTIRKQILFNNIKVAGMFIAVLVFSSPVILILFNTGWNIELASIVLFVIATIIYYKAGKLYIKGTGVLIYDCLSLSAIPLIYFVGLLTLPFESIYSLSGPYFFFILFLDLFFNATFNEPVNNLGYLFFIIIISIIIPSTAIIAGVISKNGVKRIL